MSQILGVFQSIADIFTEFSKMLAFDYMLYIIGGLLFTTIVVVILTVSATYEKRAGSKLKQMNFYLKANPQITQDNLVEFNSRMKAMPKEIRKNWQQYMVNRDKKPSDFINEANCVDKPIKFSRYNILFTVTFLWVTMLSIFSLLIGVGIYNNSITSFPTVIYTSFLLPAIIAIIGILIVMIIKWSQRRTIEKLTEQFSLFSPTLDDACKTMPKYVDYEILFTPKEIRDEIPVLKMYMDQKAEMDKRITEEDEEEKDLEVYNFDELGLDNALLLERSMKESEKYIKARNMLQDRIKSKEDEMFNYAKNFEEVTKTFEKKAQVHKEAIEQLNNQINATTVAVEANYFRNRQTKEQEALQIAESEYENARAKFDKQQDLIQREIDTYKEEVEKRKRNLEEAMKAESKTYANKVYGALAKTVREQNAPFLQKLESEKQTLTDQVNGLSKRTEDLEKELSVKTTQLDRLSDSFKIKTAEIEAMQNVKDYFTSADFIENLKGVKDREDRAKKLEEENEEVKKQLARLEQEKESVQEQIQKEREAVTAQLEQANARASKRKSNINEADLQGRLSELQLKEREIVAKTEQLKENANKLKDTVTMLSELKEELFEKEKAIEVKEAELRQLTVKLQETKSDVENTRKELLVSKKDLEKTQKLSEEKQNKLRKLREMTESIEKENMELDKKQRELKTSLSASITEAQTKMKKKSKTGEKEEESKDSKNKSKIKSSLDSLLEKASKKRD